MSDRKRELARERQRRRRARLKAGMVEIRLTVPDVDLAVALAGEGCIDPMRDDCKAELSAGVLRLLDRLIDKYA